MMTQMMSNKWLIREAKTSNFVCKTDRDKTKSTFGMRGSRFVWGIKNFLERTEQKGESLCSETFRVVGSSDTVTKWVVYVYPKGLEDSEVDNISIRLVNNSEVEVKAKFELWITNKMGEELDVFNQVSFVEPKKDLVAKNVSLNDGHWLQQDNDLAIMCQITVLETGYQVKRFHSLKMIADLEQAFIQNDSSGFDVTVIKCGEVSFECNKFMLTARSPVFKSMFQSDMVESQTNTVEIVDLKPEIVAEMLQYIHTGTASNIRKYSQELLAAADRYQLEQLKSSCQEILIASLAVENCISILLLSDKHNALELRKAALNYAAENMSSISSSCDWKKELAGVQSLMTDMIETFATMSDSLKENTDELCSLLIREMDSTVFDENLL